MTTNDSLDEWAENEKTEKPKTALPGTVQRIIAPIDPSEPERAEVLVYDAEPLYQEVRIENKLTNEKGEEVKLKPGAPVEVTIEADEKDTVKARKK